MRARSGSAPLTDRQAEVLSFVETRLRVVGVSPTLEEIRNHFGFNSVNAAREHLRLIEQKGFLEREFGKPRAIRMAGSLARQNADVVHVPLLGRIPAGEPRTAIEDIMDVLPLPRQHFRGDRLFALRVRGDSMNGAGILDGDIAVLDPDREPVDGGIAAVVLDEEATLKRLYRSEEGLRLVGENPAFMDINIPRGRFDSIRIAGIYVGLIRAH
jgi:repressor LexA